MQRCARGPRRSSALMEREYAFQDSKVSGVRTVFHATTLSTPSLLSPC